ncbi:MAG: hypothetical protein MZU97_21005 [Bacillus subtilis]|nr:hypothetical protein [Bacillus subtilis]
MTTVQSCIQHLGETASPSAPSVRSPGVIPYTRVPTPLSRLPHSWGWTAASCSRAPMP